MKDSTNRFAECRCKENRARQALEQQVNTIRIYNELKAIKDAARHAPTAAGTTAASQ